MRCRRKWQPTPVFSPGESQGREAWWTAIYGVAESDMTEAMQQQQQLTTISSYKKAFPMCLNCQYFWGMLNFGKCENFVELVD